MGRNFVAVITLCLLGLAMVYTSQTVSSNAETKKIKKAFIHSKVPESAARVQHYFLQHPDEWVLLDNSNEANCKKADFIWKARYNWSALKPHQWYNHNGLQINYHNKGLFMDLIKRYEKHQTVLRAEDVLPKSYTLSLINPKFSKEEQDFFSPENYNQYWVVKPINGRKGQGIYVTKDVEKLYKEFLAAKPDQKVQLKGVVDKESWIVQKYIHNPLLINKRKFDIRCFLYFTSFQPMVAVFYPGYVRRSIVDYNLDDLDNLFGHLVNVSLQKEHASYEQEAHNSLWMMDKLKRYVIDELRFTEEQWDTMNQKLYAQLGYMVEALKHLQKRKNYASKNQCQLFGVDITIDENLVPYVIEANIDPQLDNPHEEVMEHQLKMLHAILDLQTKTINNAGNLKRFFSLINPESILEGKIIDPNLVLIYNQVNGYSALQEIGPKVYQYEEELQGSKMKEEF